MPHTPQDFQIRIKDENYQRVFEAMEHYLTDRYMIFNHPLPENNHYHLYIFGLYRNADAIRERLRRLGFPKENYAVSVTAGKKKEKITAPLAYQYATNPKSNPVLVAIKGFTDDELSEFKAKADRYYNPPIIANPADGVLPEVIYKVDRVWERLKANMDDYKDLTIKAIKAKIASQWLNDGKAMPRPSDLHRYAVSLYYINKYQDTGVPDTAMLEQFE